MPKGPEKCLMEMIIGNEGRTRVKNLATDLAKGLFYNSATTNLMKLIRSVVR